MGFSEGCRKEQAGSLCSPEAALPSAVVRHSVPWIDLACLLEMFLSQLGHAQVLEPASEHPMVKRIFRSELVCLFFVSTCFFEFT